MTRLWTSLALSVAATSPAFAQSAGNDNDQNQQPTNDTSNQADPVETNANNPQGANGTGDTTMSADLNTAPGYVAASTRDTTYVRTTERERYGIAIAAGAGAGGFTSDSLRGSTNLGGDWDVRLTFGTRSPLAFEASYIGSAQRLTALGLDNNATLVGNGVQGALRLNGTIDLPVQPFIFGGAAWRRYDVTNSAANTSDVADKDDVLELPVGAGLAGKFRGLIVDARGEFRYTTNADLIRTGNANEPIVGYSNSEFGTMHRWGVNANVGYEF
jgi:hypothetical protein